MKSLKILTIVTLTLALTVAQSLTYANTSNETLIEDYLNIEPCYQEGIEEAIEWQIMPDGFKDVSMDNPITRGEFAEALVLTYVRLTGSLPDQWDSTTFIDQPGVYPQIASELKFVSGYTDGTYRSNNEIQRQELFVMMNNLINLLEPTLDSVQEDAPNSQDVSNALLSFNDHEEVSEWARQASSVLINLDIVAGTDLGNLEPRKSITRSQAMVIITRTLKAKDHQPESLEESNIILDELASLAHANNENPISRGGHHSHRLDKHLSDELMVMPGNNPTKYTAIFESVDAKRYASSEDALLHMVNITVDVWTLTPSGSKIPDKRTILVHSALAEVFTQVFKEIYEGVEQFPIKVVHGYSWRSSSTSEHNLGLAVDINPDENYMIRKDGTVIAGSFWLPGEDPHSIKPDGDVVRAFKKYGFTWGGDAWPTSNDYMHFSFLGW